MILEYKHGEASNSKAASILCVNDHVVVSAGGAPEVFEILISPQIWVPHPFRSFIAEGWEHESQPTDRYRILALWRSWSVISSAGGGPQLAQSRGVRCGTPQTSTHQATASPISKYSAFQTPCSFSVHFLSFSNLAFLPPGISSKPCKYIAVN